MTVIEQIIVATFYVLLAKGILVFITIVGMKFYKDKRSCSIGEGIIIAKYYRQPGTGMRLSPNSYNPTITTYDETWSIEIKGIDDRGTEGNRKLVLKKDQWQRLKVGQKFSILMIR